MQKVFLKPAELLFDAILFGYFYLIMYRPDSQITSWIKSLIHRFSVLDSWLIAGSAALFVLISMVMLLTKTSDIFTQYPQLSKLKWFGILYAIGAMFYMIISPALIEYLSVKKTDASLAILVFLIVLPVIIGLVYGVISQISSNFDYRPLFKALNQGFFVFYMFVFIPLILVMTVFIAKIQDPHYAWLPFAALLLMRIGAIFYDLKISYLNLLIMLIVLALDFYVTVSSRIVV